MPLNSCLRLKRKKDRRSLLINQLRKEVEIPLPASESDEESSEEVPPELMEQRAKRSIHLSKILTYVFLDADAVYHVFGGKTPWSAS